MGVMGLEFNALAQDSRCISQVQPQQKRLRCRRGIAAPAYSTS